MKKNRMRVMASLIAASALVAGGAGAETVAGWDFSQYRGDGALTPFASTLPANYSALDPTGNAGAESASYGNLSFSGTFLPLSGTMNCKRRGKGFANGGCAYDAKNGPVASNHDEPWPNPGDVSFDAFGILRAEGQTYTHRLAMAAFDPVTAVFEADPSAAGSTGSDWRISFGGKIITGAGDDGGPVSCDPDGAGHCSSTVTIEYSSDGSSYTSYGSVTLTADDTRYDVALDTASAGTGFVRLGLAPGAGDAVPMIDNVAVTATLPEPGVTMMMAAGVLGLTVLKRRRA